MTAAPRLTVVLEADIDTCEATLRSAGADHRHVPPLLTAPGPG